MDIKNIDGFVSGGYIFNELDKFAQHYAMTINKKKYCFTAWAIPMFHKQLCVPDFYVGFNWKFKLGKRIFVKVYMKDKYGVKVASCIFCFIETNKNYCKREL